jgi:AraC-like DNA-binding protein
MEMREGETSRDGSLRRTPAAALRTHVRSYEAYDQVHHAPVRDIHLPSGDVPLIIGFGDPLVSLPPEDPSDLGRAHQTFVAGLYESSSATDSGLIAHGIQVNFTPVGAYQFLGLPMHELTNRVVELEDVMGAEAPRLVASLIGAATAQARFDMLDAMIARRLAQSVPASEGVAWAWRQLETTHGRTAISRLTSDLGWSRKQTVARFREQVGLPPKTLARILRFQHAVRLTERSDEGRWAQVALQAGYYDQAHLIRDFRAFAQSTPGAYVARRRAERAAGRG